MIKPGMYISDRYEIIDKVGSGGMADVYKAKCHRLNRYVAIKILKPEYSSDKNFVTKFRGEAQSAAGLSHPNIVNVYDVGDDDGLYYIVMELVEGITLKKFIERKGRLEIKEAVGIAIQIAQGMEAAHDNHIIHRDIKPQNIIISREGKVKVTDFGIAKAATSNTVTQNAIGSVHYLSPEQARGGYSDEKSDIYSLGVTLYEMLSGKVPFAGDNTVSVALLHIQGEAIPVRELNPTVPPSVDMIVQKCMQKKPERRYLTASELIQDLKKSIVNPEGDFVKLSSATVTDSPTINMTDDEMEEIKSAAKTPAMYYSNHDAKAVSKIQKEEEEELDTVDSKVEKVLTVGSVIAVIILGVAVLYVIANFFGLIDKVTGDGGSLVPTVAVTASPSPTVSPTVSPTPALVTMPYLLGQTPDYAESNTLAAGNFDFDITYEEDYSDEYEAGQIMKQYPAEGTSVARTAPITLWISSGKEPTELGDVYNRTLDEAKETLVSKGYTVQVEYEADSMTQYGHVIRTIPERYEIVDEGSVVILIVSLGEQAVYTTVPNLLGQTEEAALTLIADAKLTAGTMDFMYSSTYEAGLVCAQSYDAGTSVEESAVINYFISLGADPNGGTDTTPTQGAEPTSSPDTTPTDAPTATPEPTSSETTYRGTLAIDATPIPDSGTANIYLELVQGSTTIKLFEQDDMTATDFKEAFFWYIFNIQSNDLSEGTATVILYVDGAKYTDETFLVDLEVVN